MREEEFADIETFRSAMRRTANSVCVVTTDGPRGRAGLTVSSMVSVSGEPPMLLVCINRRSAVHDVVRDNAQFVVNVLGDSQQQIADNFAGRGDKRYDFADGAWIPGGMPMLRHAAARFRCVLELQIPAGSHSVFIGRIMAADAGQATPLLYSDRSYGRPVTLERYGTDSVLEHGRRSDSLITYGNFCGGNHEQHSS